jgi:hypothetical protein
MRKFLQNLFRSTKSIVCLVLAIMLIGLIAIRWSPWSQKASSRNNQVANRADVLKSMAKLPLAFEPNRGQTDPQAKWLSRGSGYTVFLTDKEAVVRMKNADKETVAHIKFAGAGSAKAEGIERQPGYSNYYGVPGGPVEKIPNYGGVRYSNVYPGVDAVFRGNETNLRFDYLVKPGSDPRAIELAYDGLQDVRINPNGDLALDTGNGVIVQHKPYIYQQVWGKRVEIAGGYRSTGDGTIGFELGNYDKSRELVIDPTLTAGTYLGGTGLDNIRGIAQDSTYVYAVGDTTSSVFPSGQAGTKPGTDNQAAFVVLMARNGSGLTVRTYITNGAAASTTQTVIARGAALGTYNTTGGGTPSDKVLYVVGDSVAGVTLTSSGGTAFAGAPPTTVGAATGTSAFIAAIDTGLGATGTAGILDYGTYIGSGGPTNTNYGYAVTTDGGKNVWIAGSTTGGLANTTALGTATQSIYQGGATDGYVAYAAVSPGVTAVAATIADKQDTYVGGGGADSVNAIAYSSLFTEVFAAGSTTSTAANSFPSTNGTAYPQNQGGQDGFVVDLNAVVGGANLTGVPVAGTFIGGTGTDSINGIALDAAGNVYVTGQTNSSTGIATASVYQAALNGANSAAFVAKLTSSLTLTGGGWGTYLGGSGDTVGNAIAVDVNGQTYITGQTSSSNFPTPVSAVGGTQPLQNGSAFSGASAPFLARLNFFGSVLNYGGIDGSSGVMPAVGSGPCSTACGGGLALALDTTTAANTAFFGGTTVGGIAVTTAPVPFQNSFQGQTDAFFSGVLFNDLSLPIATPSIAAGNVFSFTQTGGVVPAAQTNSVTFNVGTPTVTIGAVSYGAGASGWLNTPAIAGGVLTVTPAASNTTLTPGNYSATFTLSGNFDNSPVNVTVNLTVNSTILVTSAGTTESGGGTITRTFTKGGSTVGGTAGVGSSTTTDTEVVSSLPNPLAYTAAVTSYGTAAVPIVVPTGCSSGWLSVGNGQTVAAAGAPNFTITYNTAILQSIDLTGLPLTGGLPSCTATITYTIPSGTPATVTTTELVTVKFTSRLQSTPSFSVGSPLTFNFALPTSPAQNQTVFQTGDGIAIPYASAVAVLLTQSSGPAPAETCPVGALTATAANAGTAPDSNAANSGGTASSVVITVNPNLCNAAAGLPATYTGSVTLTPGPAVGGPVVTIPVTVNVGNNLATTVPGGTTNFVGLTNPLATSSLPGTLLFTGPSPNFPGESINTDTAGPSNVTFTVSGTNPNSAAFTYTTPFTPTTTINLGGAVTGGAACTAAPNWLVATPATGTASTAAPDTVTASVVGWAGLASSVAGCQYNGKITVTGTGVGVSPQVIPVQFTKITQPLTAANVPTAINIVGQVGQGSPISCTVTGVGGSSGTTSCAVNPTIAVSGGVPTGTYTLTGTTAVGVTGTGTPYPGYAYPADGGGPGFLFNGTTNPAGWLTFSPAATAGTISGANVSIGANLTNLAAGTYTGTILVRNGTSPATTYSGNNPYTIPVTLTLYGTPALNITPTNPVTFSYIQGNSTSLASQTMNVNVATTNPAGATLTYTTTASSAACGGTSWLVLTPGAGQAKSTNPAPEDSFTLSINPACLSGPTALAASGVPYTGNIQVVSPQASAPTQNIPVQLTITTPVISATPSTISPFTFTIGGSNPASQSVNVSTTPAGQTVTVTPVVNTPVGGSWLGATLVGGVLTVTVNPAGLAATAPNTPYTGFVNLTAGGFGLLSIPVQFTVLTAPQIVPTATTATFNYTLNSTNQPAAQVIPITVNGTPIAMTAGAPTYLTGGSPGWLTATLSTTALTSAANLNLSVNTTGLAVGTYTASVAITSPGVSTVTVTPVTLVVSASPTLSASTSTLAFYSTLGNAAAPASQTFNVTGSTPGLQLIPSPASGTPSWLTYTQTSGVVPASVTVSVNQTGLAAGPYSATINLNSAAGSGVAAVPITVNFTVNPQPVVTPAAPTASFLYTIGGTAPASTTVGLTGTPAVSSLVASGTGTCGWLTTGLTATTTPANLTLAANVTGLSAGTYTCTVAVNGTSTATPTAPAAPAVAGTVVVTIQVLPQPVLVTTPSGPMTFSSTFGPGGSSTVPSPQVLTISATSTPAYWATNPLGVTAAVASGSSWLSISGGGTTSFPLTVSVTPGTLAAGIYNGSITLTSSAPATASGAATLTIPVTLNIVNTNAISPALVQMSFNDVVGGSVAPYLPAAQSNLITINGGAAIPVTATASSSVAGLFSATLSPASGINYNLAVSVNLAAVPTTAGTYTGNVALTAPNVGTVNIPVSVTVAYAPPITPTPTSMAFGYTLAGAAPATQTLNVPALASPFPGINFPLTATGSNGIVVTGTGPFTVSLSSSLPTTPGTYNGTVTLSSATGSGVNPVTVPVTLTVYAQPVLTAGSAAGTTYTIGQTIAAVGGSVSLAGTSPAPGTAPIQGLAVINPSGQCGWLAGNTATLSSTALPANVVFTPGGTLTTMLPGTYTCTVTVTGSTTGALGAPAVSTTATASMMILPQPVINAATTPVVFTSPNGVTTAVITVTTANPLGIPVTATATVTAPTNGTWLTATLSGGVGGVQSLTITATPGTLGAGTYAGNVLLTGSNGASYPAAPVNIPVSLIVSSSGVGFFQGQTSIGGGYYGLQLSDGNPFGFYTYLANNVIYHLDLGYEATVQANDGVNGIYLYDFASGHWWYTNPASFPNVYDFTLKSWIYYYPAPTVGTGRYTSSPRVFFNYTTNTKFNQ